MFNDLLESTLLRKKTNRSWTVVVSSVLQTLVLSVLVLIPLMHTEALSRTILSTLLIAPPPPPPSPSQPVKVIVKPGVRLPQAGILRQPTAIPKKVVMLIEPELPPEMPSTPIMNGIFSNIDGQTITGTIGPAAPPKPTIPNRIKQGGVVTAASILAQTAPVYPALARQAHIQGNVVLHAIIDRDGRVAQLEVVSGHPLLVRAAMEAVKQWRYKPTLLNSEPVEVDTTISVNFRLEG